MHPAVYVKVRTGQTYTQHRKLTCLRYPRINDITTSIHSGARFEGSIGVVGAGRLGGALATALLAAGYAVSRVASRTHERAEALATRLEGARAVEAAAVVGECDLVVLAVPDAAIEAVAAALPWRAGQAGVHCSGALGLDVLAAVSAAGGLVGCLHPLQSFPSLDGAVERFRGVTCGIEAATPLDGWLATMARDLGARPLDLAGVDRALYHAAAVLVSNDAVALMAAATQVWSAAGLPREEARGALAPLLLGAARNIQESELHRALTGPVARGDVATIERHLRALQAVAGRPELAHLYRALARQLLGLPLDLDPATRARLAAALEG